ncbi:MAG: hypothetical protein Unbinned3325contig1000_48 [Prokaryotic dsDNA virus sp.]|nr:MAG: hypothetical protein Unbinned3325contig1000_48 [Prokaryotic dsDNA virus sp.]
MEYEVTVKNIENDEKNKIVGFNVTTNENQRLAIDKSIPLKLSKTTQQYISEALNEAKPEINEWLASLEFQNAKIDPETGEIIA